MHLFRKILAVETSCDDTSVAIVGHDSRVFSCLLASQDEEHAKFGGIVPEIASRNHTFHLLPMIQKALAEAEMELSDIDGFAVTNRPGLIGSLLTGLVTVKALSLATGKPFIGVNHLEGHLLAPFLTDEDYAPPKGFDFPYIALAVSGGHTTLYFVEGFGQYRVLGRSLDDAAGEAFDKFAKKVGLGFPGGPRVDRLAKFGSPDRFHFPRAMLKEERDDMSFSGLKTAAARLFDEFLESDRQSVLHQAEAFISNSRAESGLLADLCASFQEALTDVLYARLTRAVLREGVSRVVLTGGVAANTRLRERVYNWTQARNISYATPPLRYCTDNAAMIGLAGVIRLNLGEKSTMSLGPFARAPLDHEKDL